MVREFAITLAQLSMIILALFGLATWIGFEAWLGDPLYRLQSLGPWAVIASLLLLWADVLLPIPSSLCMIANGSIFGVYQGALISLVGGVGATLVAHLLGKRYQRHMTRDLSEQDQARSQFYLTKWGAFAIVVTRPVPILAESVAILSGALPYGLTQIIAYATLGHLVPCVLYAQVGASLSTM